MTLRIGTRASTLATTQSELVAARLSELHGVDVELVSISTQGDRSDAPLDSFAKEQHSVGVFVGALREAVASGEVDLAVHSLKDLPTTADPRLTLAAIPQREDPRDVLVARDRLTLGELPQGARVGTGSPRRTAQINALGLGVEVVGIRGNVDTRLGRVASGDIDAVVIAYAALVRLRRTAEATEVLDPLQILPAPGQGALACECRADDVATTHLLDVLDDPDTRAAVTAERSLLATLEAGCSAPVGALAEIAWGTGPNDEASEELWLRAVVADITGAPSIRLSATGSPSDAAAVGERLAAEMLAEGAASLIGVAS